MPITYDDSTHFAVGSTSANLNSETGVFFRWSEITLAALRAAGVLDSMVDGTVAPTDLTIMWLDTNSDPGVLKRYNTISLGWVEVTYEWFTGQSSIGIMATPTGTPDALIVPEPDNFFGNRLFSITPIANNTGATTIQITSIGTYDVKYTDGTDIDAAEFVNGEAALVLFTGVRFEVLVKLASSRAGTAPDADQVAFTPVPGNPATDVQAAIANNTTPTPGPYLVVITGQSNAAGANSGGLNPASSLVKTWDGVTGAWGGSDHTALPWSRTAPDGNGSNNNFALARAHRIADETGRNVYIVFDASGGTSIGDWVDSGSASVRYAALEVKINAALATTEFTSTGKTTVDEIIWSQGEADFTETFATHAADLLLLTNQFRAEPWFDSAAPIYFMGPSALHERYEWLSAFRNHCSYVDSASIFIPSHGLDTSDNTHFDGPGLWEAGYYRIAAAAPTELPRSYFYARGDGPANPFEATALCTFSSIVSFDSWTQQNPGNSSAATGSFTWGFECSSDGNYSYTLGYQCTTDNLANYTLLAGREINADANADYGAALGFQHELSNSFAFAAGRGHDIADEGGAAVGLFSEYILAEADNVRFQVGIGTSAAARKNALTARASGAVEINTDHSNNPSQQKEITFQWVSNTSLKVLMKGTDDVVRSVDFTLA